MLFGAILGVVALLSGAVAAVTGFGIGSLLTPTLAIKTGTKLAVAAIAIPHFIATARRFWMLCRHVDRRVLLGFGIASAVGGLTGALIHTRVSSAALAVVFGVLLVLAGLSELTGWMQHVRWDAGRPGSPGPCGEPSAGWSETREASGRRPCSASTFPRNPSSPPPRHRSVGRRGTAAGLPWLRNGGKC